MAINIAFVCSDNACVSQIAQAVLKYHFPNVGAHSGGVMIEKNIDLTAKRLLESKGYGTSGLYPKSYTKLPKVDVLITLGSAKTASAIPHRYHEEWSIENPSFQSDDVYNRVIDDLRNRIFTLINTLKKKGLV